MDKSSSEDEDHRVCRGCMSTCCITLAVISQLYLASCEILIAQMPTNKESCCVWAEAWSRASITPIGELILREVVCLDSDSRALLSVNSGTSQVL